MPSTTNVTHLRQIPYQQQDHFSLSIDPDSKLDFTCTHITRCLPGKRISCLGLWKGKKIFAKLFIAPKRAKKHWHKERAGIELLSNKKIATASTLFSGNTCNKEIYFIFFEFIPNAQPLQLLWDDAKSNEQNHIISKLLITIAEHHNKGILQKDLHLNNFVLSQDKIYTLDASDITSFDNDNENQRYKNLAQLFAQLPPSHDTKIEANLRSYAEYYQWPSNTSLLPYLIDQTQKQRDLRKHDYMAKSQRECALFCATKSGSQLSIYAREYHSDALLQFLASPDQFIENGVFLKQGKSSTVSKVTIGQKQWLVKRYNIKSLTHFLSRAFRPSRALKSWKNANLLSFYKIKTPVPIAIIEKRFGPIRKTSYFITKYSPGKTYWDFLYQSDTPSTEEKKSIVKSIHSLFQSLKSLKISHGDFKISNLMIEKDGISLIDLDAMQQHSNQRTFEKAHIKDINRFFKNWKNDQVNASYFNKDHFLDTQ
jgi:tRNA A-37 threonylcarbamoyl transferase component Bud32